MRIVRLSGLMLLTLAATLAPASARSAPVRESDPPVAPENAAPESGAAPSEQEDTPEPKPLPAPELWDGSAGRLAGKAPGPMLVDLLVGETPRSSMVPPIRRTARFSPRPAPAPDLTGWRVGHYAHAPPRRA